MAEEEEEAGPGRGREVPVGRAGVLLTTGAPGGPDQGTGDPRGVPHTTENEAALAVGADQDQDHKLRGQLSRN